MVLLCDGCTSCHPIISVKALKETQSTKLNQLPVLILSLSNIELLTEGLLLPLLPVPMIFLCPLNLSKEKSKPMHNPIFGDHSKSN